MKRFLLFALLGILVGSGCASGAKKEKVAEFSNSRLNEIVGKYRCTPGFRVVSVGSLGTSIAKSVMNRAAKQDEDARLVSEIISGIRKVVVMEFENADYSVKSEFRDSLNNFFNTSDLLLEAKDDDGEVIRIYGIVSDDGASVHDFILYTPTDDALVCLFGNVDMDSVGKLVEANI